MLDSYIRRFRDVSYAQVDMISRVIVGKMKLERTKDAPLCSTLFGAIANISNVMPERYSKAELISFMAGMVAEVILPHDIPRHLSKSSQSYTSTTNSKQVALVTAVVLNDFDLMDLLIADGADLNTIALPLGSPLDAAARHGRVRSYKFLEIRGARPPTFSLATETIRRKFPWECRTLLEEAVRSGREDMVHVVFQGYFNNHRVAYSNTQAFRAFRVAILVALKMGHERSAIYLWEQWRFQYLLVNANNPVQLKNELKSEAARYERHNVLKVLRDDEDR
jgi:hypothetical protein